MAAGNPGLGFNIATYANFSGEASIAIFAEG
jgi:hypothetical protein